MNTLTVTMTEGQASALLQLLDLAVKAGGMGVARAALEIDDLVRHAAITQTAQTVQLMKEE